MTTTRLLRSTLMFLPVAVASIAGAAAQPASPAAPAQAAPSAQEPAADTGSQALPERNVRVTVTLTDQLGTTTPVVRTALMTIADGRQGQIRSQTSIRRDVRKGPADSVPTPVVSDQLPLNVDAWVNTTASGAVLLRLGFTYFVTGSDALGDTGFVVTRRDLTENFSVLLRSGQSMVVSESADPVSDRKVKVEVKAEILP